MESAHYALYEVDMRLNDDEHDFRRTLTYLADHIHKSSIELDGPIALAKEQFGTIILPIVMPASGSKLYEERVRLCCQ